MRQKPNIPGGGSDSRTATGELRWSFHLQYRDDWRDKHDAFRRGLMESEHMRLFEQFAQAMRNLPESSWNSGPEWSSALSSSASTFLKALDTLHDDQPGIALKIAGIVAGTSSMHYVLAKEATRRICDWMADRNLAIQERMALGCLIRETWPEINPPEQLDTVLLELFMQASVEAPELVAQMCQRRWAVHGATGGYVISITDDPAKVLVIGRNLKSIAPDFCMHVYRNYLFSGRIQHRGFSPSEHDLREVAAEYFALLSTQSSPHEAAYGDHYFNLSQWAYREADWYPEVLERLYSAAQACDNPTQAAEWCRAVVMNAERHSTVFALAMHSFGTYVQSYTRLLGATDYALWAFADFVASTLDIAAGERVLRGRNIDVPPDTDHPIRKLAIEGYWGLVSWAAEQSSASVLSILVVAIERGDAEFAQAAVIRMTDVFEALAGKDAMGAAAALGKLSCNDWYSDVSESRKSRCRGLVGELMPVLECISPEAAQHARLMGRNPMWDR